jgi:cytochrome c biogenesis protein CcmG/thiol:disulfide interchange protein DsbE
MEIPDDANQDEKRRGSSLVWLATAAIAILVVALLAYSLASRPGSAPQVGDLVPEFQLTSLDGRPMDLASQRGNVVVINVFASWCDPCRQEAADLEQVWRLYRDRGVQFYGIAYKDAESKAQAFLDEFGVSYPSTVEPGNRTARAYGLTGVPETFVVDQQGQLVRHFLGPITQAELIAEIDPMLSE